MIRKILAAALLLSTATAAQAMDVSQQGTTLTLTGANFRYTWDTRRGGEMTSAEQPGLPAGGEEAGWWNKGQMKISTSHWQRINSTFAWKSLDTIPALSFSTKRGAYYSGEWNVAYANADRKATLKVLKQAADEVVFETQSHPRIFENLRAPVPWVVKQTVRVFDSGIVLTRLEIELPKDETYELDWSAMSVNLDDSLYKEPHPEKQWKFAYVWAYPGESELLSNFYKPVLQDLPHLPLDIDIKPEKSILTEKPILFGGAGYDLTHVQGAPPGASAEWCLENARSLIRTKDDFGSYLMVRPQSGMSLVPTDVGSMRGEPCMSAGWNLFDGKTQGLADPITYRNTLAFATATRKHSSLADAPADDRNNLLGARIYFAKDKMPGSADVQAMAAEGCDTLILPATWKADEAGAAAVVKAAHAAGIRVGATVNARDFKTLVTDAGWFSRVFEKDRDGVYLANASFLANAPAADDFQLDGETVSFKTDGVFRANAPAFAVCMHKLRTFVGGRGFLIGEDAPPGPTVLSSAECDLHASSSVAPYYNGTAAAKMGHRNRAPAGFAPMLASMNAEQAATAAMLGDTPIVLWPAKDRQHVTAWWNAAKKLPPKGFRMESDLLPTERRFTTSSPDVHGMLCDGGDATLTLLLAAEKASANVSVTFSMPGASVTDDAGKTVNMSGKTFAAGDFAAWQVKVFHVSAPKEQGK